MQEVLARASKGEVESVIIVKLDRMFRNTVDALNTARDFDKKGIALHSISESLDTQSAMGKFFFTLTAALAEMERGLIGERTRTALARKKERGEKTGGNVPYGFDSVEGMLVENPREQEVIRIIKKKRLQGRSYQGIADFLNEKGTPTKTGKSWTAVQVNRLEKTSHAGWK